MYTTVQDPKIQFYIWNIEVKSDSLTINLLILLNKLTHEPCLKILGT